MPTFNDEQQQPTTPVAPPSTTSEAKDWEAEATKLQRQLDSVRGNLEQEKKRSSDIDTQLRKLTGDLESERATLNNEKKTLTQELENERQTKAQFEADLKKYQRQLAIMGLANQNYPSLIPLLTGTEEEPPVLVIPDNVKTTEELEAFLSRAQAKLSGVVKQQGTTLLQGSAPQPPSTGQLPAMTLEEVQDKKNEAARARKWDVHSQYSRMEEDMLRKMFTPK